MSRPARMRHGSLPARTTHGSLPARVTHGSTPACSAWSAAVAGFFLVALGCAPEPRAADQALPRGAAGTLRWRELTAELAALRRERAPGPHTVNLAVVMTHPQLGVRLRARGAAAVSPPEALRLVLVGPGGGTALDLWIAGDAFRLELPALELVKRGDARADADEHAALPVAFLRAWLVRPFDGRLLYAYDRDDGSRLFRLRDGAVHATLERHRDRSLTLSRSSRGGREQAHASAESCGHARYVNEATGLVVEVVCESQRFEPPPARAFADPDEPTASPREPQKSLTEGPT